MKKRSWIGPFVVGFIVSHFFTALFAPSGIPCSTVIVREPIKSSITSTADRENLNLLKQEFAALRQENGWQEEEILRLNGVQNVLLQKQGMEKASVVQSFHDVEQGVTGLPKIKATPVVVASPVIPTVGDGTVLFQFSSGKECELPDFEPTQLATIYDWRQPAPGVRIGRAPGKGVIGCSS